MQSENASNTGKGERGVEGHYKKRVERGWEHESKEASLSERSEQRAEGGQRGLGGGRGREGGCADAAPSLLSYCRPSAFILVREEALEGFEKRYDVMGLSSNRPLALL